MYYDQRHHYKLIVGALQEKLYLWTLTSCCGPSDPLNIFYWLVNANFLAANLPLFVFITIIMHWMFIRQSSLFFRWWSQEGSLWNLWCPQHFVTPNMCVFLFNFVSNTLAENLFVSHERNLVRMSARKVVRQIFRLTLLSAIIGRIAKISPLYLGFIACQNQKLSLFLVW